jgi:hypothetical protein
MTIGTSLGIKSRPLDFFVAFLVFFLGFYGFLDPTWPERFDDSILYWIVTIEDLYFVTAGAVIMSALIIKQMCANKLGKWFVRSLVAEMFGWLFISISAAVTALTIPWIPPSVFAAEEGPLLWVWFFLWAGLSSSAFVRYLDIRTLGRHSK